jgi:DNA-binding MltR family transcriptional regulator
MSDTFLFDKINDYRRVLGANFWMRAAQLDDRSLVLVTTSKLDELLAVAIVAKCRFMAEKKSFERVFSGEGPLSRFAHKISVANLLGLLVGDTLHDITILRKIRNDFAHDYTFKNLSTREISNRCKSLKMHIDLAEETLNLAGTAERKAFLSSAAMITLHVSIVVQRAASELHILQKYRDELNEHARAAIDKAKRGEVIELPSNTSETSPVVVH